MKDFYYNKQLFIAYYKKMYNQTKDPIYLQRIKELTK